MDENKDFTNGEFEEEDAGMVIRAESIEIEEAKGEAASEDAAEAQEGQADKKKKDPMREILEWVVCIALALVLTFTMKAFLFDVVVVDGPSMQSTLQNGDRLILTKIGYTPARGDIVVLDAHYKAREAYFETRRATDADFGAFDEFSAVYLQRSRAKSLGIEKKYYVKRIIALEGDTVDIDPIAGTVTVNGEVLEEAYLDENTITPLGYGMQYPYTVEPGCVFVMGDNRAQSLDSRYSELGTVPAEAVSGKVTLRLLPITKFGGLYE